MRIERGPGGREIRRVVECVEEACQRKERTLVPLLLGEEPQHRLEPDESDLQAVRLAPRAVVAPYQRGTGHRL